MSNLVFPALAGIDIKVTRKEIYSTLVQPAASGKELRASYQSTPRYRYSMHLNFARQSGFSVNTLYDELNTLVAFFRTHRGRYDSFWLPDPVAANLIPNPTSEDANPTGPGLSGLIIAGAAPLAYAGMKVRGVLSSTGYPILTDNIACAPGEQMLFSAMVRSTGTYTTGLRIRFLDSSLANLTDIGTTDNVYSPWTQMTLAATAPANAAYCYFFLAGVGSGVGLAFFDNIFGCRMEAAGLSSVPDGVSTRAQLDAIQIQRKVRFDQDELTLERLFNLVWAGGSIEFISVK